MITAEEWLTLGAAIVGVAGTLAASVITYALANKQERKRWIQEREDRNQLWKRENVLRFHAEKRAAYSELIGRMHLWHTQMGSQLHGEYGGQAYDPDGGFDRFEKEITMLRGQLDLIAPPQVRSAAEVLWGAGAAIALTLALPDQFPEEQRKANVSHFTGYLTKCIRLMREDLDKCGE